MYSLGFLYIGQTTTFIGSLICRLMISVDAVKSEYAQSTSSIKGIVGRYLNRYLSTASIKGIVGRYLDRHLN